MVSTPALRTRGCSVFRESVWERGSPIIWAEIQVGLSKRLQAAQKTSRTRHPGLTENTRCDSAAIFVMGTSIISARPKDAGGLISDRSKISRQGTYVDGNYFTATLRARSA